MATNTTNFNFKKPDESDFYSVQDQNNNWDKADAALKDLDTPTFEDYSGSTTVPDAATAINSIRSKGKLYTILSNMKAAFKGACLIGQIVNNCVTNNAKLPLSAAQGKALMDLYTQLNSDLGKLYNYSNNVQKVVDDQCVGVALANYAAAIRAKGYQHNFSFVTKPEYTPDLPPGINKSYVCRINMVYIQGDDYRCEVIPMWQADIYFCQMNLYSKTQQPWVVK